MGKKQTMSASGAGRGRTSFSYSRGPVIHGLCPTPFPGRASPFKQTLFSSRDPTRSRNLGSQCHFLCGTGFPNTAEISRTYEKSNRLRTIQEHRFRCCSTIVQCLPRDSFHSSWACGMISAWQSVHDWHPLVSLKANCMEKL